MRLVPPSALVLGVTFWIGCGAEEPESVRRYSVGDTAVIENLAPEIGDTLHPVVVQRYGLVSGDPDYLFGDIFAFAVGPDGDVFVHDRNEGIRRYSVDGQFIGRVARAGEGPSEVDYLAALEVAPDGRVIALDLGNRRIAIFEEGKNARTVRMPDGRPPYKDGAIVVHESGDLFVGINPLYPQDGGITHPRPIFVRVADDGSLVDTLKTPRWISHHCPELSSAQYSAGFWEDRREPFVPKVKWALGNDGTLAVGCPATYRFYLIRPDGTVMRIARARAPTRVSDEERAFRTSMPVPSAGETLPAYAKIRLSDDGRTWVWPSQPSIKMELDPEATERFGVTHTWVVSWRGSFDVFTPDGRWLAVVELPKEARYSGFPTEPGVVIRGDTLWAVEQDEFDVQIVVRYEVPGLDPSKQ